MAKKNLWFESFKEVIKEESPYMVPIKGDLKIIERAKGKKIWKRPGLIAGVDITIKYLAYSGAGILLYKTLERTLN